MKSFTSTVIPAYIEIGKVYINCEKDIKLLGITIDDKLKFDKQVDILCIKAAEYINVLYGFMVFCIFK